jgi:hydroxymethylpyrimidine/phosphomethylpyrimidine kinase
MRRGAHERNLRCFPMSQASAALNVPIALTIAGSDCSGGAGIQADLKTFSALGVYGASVITALTAQNTLGVQAVQPVEHAFITQQLTSVLSDLAVSAIKTGMLPDADAICAVTRALDDHPDLPIVVDPVLIATSGDKLAAEDVAAVLKRELLPRATVLTPNLPEAAVLLGTDVATSEMEQLRQGEALRALGAQAVLVKGGHGVGATARDVLVGDGEPVWFGLPRLATDNTHGTGCTLAAAIAALLAQGADLTDAVLRAKRYVWEAISSGRSMTIGAGNGPIDHLYAIRAGKLPV